MHGNIGLHFTTKYVNGISVSKEWRSTGFCLIIGTSFALFLLLLDGACLLEE